MILELSDEAADHLLAAELALCRLARFGGGTGRQKTYDTGRLRSLDGKTVGLDGCPRAGGFGLLVLALDTGFLGDRHGEGVCVEGVELEE